MIFMKNLVLSLGLSLGLSVGLQAQIGPSFFLGGGLGFSRTSGQSTTTLGSTSTTVQQPVGTTFNLAPRFGMFFTENIGAGLFIPYNQSRSTTILNNGDKRVATNTNLGFGIFGRYAMALGDNDNFYFFGDLGLGLTQGRNKVTQGSTSTDGARSRNLDLGLSAGFIFFPTPQIGLEASFGNLLGFSNSRVTDEDDIPWVGKRTTVTQTNQLHLLNLSTISLNFGLHYYFKR